MGLIRKSHEGVLGEGAWECSSLIGGCYGLTSEMSSHGSYAWALGVQVVTLFGERPQSLWDRSIAGEGRSLDLGL